MDERVTHGSASELTGTEAKIKNLVDEVSKLSADLKNWKLDIDVNVEADQNQKLQIVITVKGKEGLTLYIPHDKVMYMASDKTELLAQATRKIIEDCLVNIVKADLANKLSKAVDNVVQLTTRKSALG